jgi:ectoine hydroxylase-related dioxygenase (phytanoyl-CoA dioxygenase family)
VSEFFQKHGYEHIPGVFPESTIAELEAVIVAHHAAWTKENRKFYRDNAVNSAYLTKPGLLNDGQRLHLFQFVGQLAQLKIARELLNENMCFMNTQLFFNPHNVQQHNYWHRDMQYTGLNEAEQKAVLYEKQILHFRIALRDEPGIELIPGTHARWDTPEEYSVRLEKESAREFDALPDSTTISMRRGDLLVFSANMIHRGLYGMDRLALDVIFFSPLADLHDSVQVDNLPNQSMMPHIEHSRVFFNTLAFFNSQ